MKQEKVFLRASIDNEGENIRIDVDDEIAQIEHLVGSILIILSELINKKGIKKELLIKMIEDELEG